VPELVDEPRIERHQVRVGTAREAAIEEVAAEIERRLVVALLGRPHDVDAVGIFHAVRARLRPDGLATHAVDLELVGAGVVEVAEGADEVDLPLGVHLREEVRIESEPERASGAELGHGVVGLAQLLDVVRGIHAHLDPDRRFGERPLERKHCFLARREGMIDPHDRHGGSDVELHRRSRGDLGVAQIEDVGLRGDGIPGSRTILLALRAVAGEERDVGEVEIRQVR